MEQEKLAEALASACREGPRMVGPILTIAQFEQRHPATKNRVRRWILQADAGCTEFTALRQWVIRIGRSVMVDESGVLAWLETHTRRRPSRARSPNGRFGGSSRRSFGGRR